MNRAQAQQIFVYMLTVIVIGLILLLGSRYIFKIIDQMKQVDMVKFKTTLEQEATTYRSYGRWKNLEISVPGSIKEVCFVDTSQDAPAADNPFCQERRLLCDAWKDKTQNVITEPFIVDTPIDIGDIKLKNPSTSNSYLCVPVVGGKIHVQFAGGAQGKLEISEWS